MDEPLKAVGLTDEANAIMGEIFAKGIFAQETDIAKLAIAHAVALKLHPKKIARTNTKWAVGNFDPDEQVRDLLRAVYPQEEPTHAMRDLMSQGLLSLAEKYRAAGSWNLSGLVSAVESPAT